MAESARQLDDQQEDKPVYDKPGNAPSDPRPELIALEGGGETTKPKKGHLKSDDEQPTGEEISRAEKAPGATSGSSDESFYKPVQPQKSWRGKKGINTKNPYRRYIIFGGIGAGIIALIIALFSFLNIFKLDGLMSNIEQRAFLRHNASLNTRSSKWISSYIEARMLQVGDNPNDNLLFRSNRVDTNSPFTDWYRTLRASNFEQKIFNDKGIKFVSVVGADGKVRPGKITVSGQNDIGVNLTQGELDNISQLKPDALSKYESFINLDTFDNNKQARLAIKEIVNNNTHWFQIYKRRFLRRSIQNMTGVRSWRFFETTKDKITDKKIDIRTRIIADMVPETNVLGRVTRCIFGVDKCAASRDVADPKTQVSVADLATAPADDTTPQSVKDAEKALSTDATKLDETAMSETLRNILEKAGLINTIINIPSTLDMLSNIDKGVSNLVKYVVIARGAQAAGLFQVFATSRDQIKTGQVSGDEVNAFMQGIDTAGSSAGWSQVISDSSSSPPGTTQTGGQCTQKAQALQEKQPDKYKAQYGDYAPLCADQQIGSASNAQQIQTAYNDSLHPIVHPIVALWEGAKNNGFFGPIINAVEWFTNHIFNALANVMSVFLDALGLKGEFNSLITWVFTKVSSFLGISILKGYESAGTIFNWLLQGGAYSAESSSRQEGAALTNPASKAATLQTVAQYQQDQKRSMSFYDKVASLNNPDSLAFHGATTLTNLKSDPSGSFVASMHGLFGSMSKNLGSMFAPKIFAASPSGYAASQFAGIETYDYPQKCYNNDPITQQPIDGTNAPEVLTSNGISVPASLYTWDTERSSAKFYKAIYDAIGEKRDNGDDIAVQIYNCNLLDTAVRGSLGYLYGYNADSADQVIDSSTPITTP